MAIPSESPPRAHTTSRGRSRTRSKSTTPLSARDRSPTSPPRRPISRSLSRTRDASRTPVGERRRSYTPSRSRSRSLSSRASASPDPRVEGGRATSQIVVEKLTKNVTEDHIREIFEHYGPIADVQVPLNRTYMTNRGIAYIRYAELQDAERAIAHMHEAQLDGAIINVSIVLERRRFSRSPSPLHRGGPPARDRGGYGRDSGNAPPRRSVSRGQSPPRRHRSRSYSSRSASRSRSRSPPRRGGGGYRRRDSPPRRGGNQRRRSPSYSSYSSRSARSPTRSRSRSP